MLLLYQFLSFLLTPLIIILIKIRTLKGKEDKKRYIERYGISSIKRPNGKLIWIHAASVGEFKSASLIINNFHKNYNILVTTTTLSAANYAKENYKDKIIHQFAPFDVKIWVERFIKKWNPDLILWIESDLWPITLNLIKKNSIKSILINLRISPNSLYRWVYFKTFYNNMLSCFEKIFVQSPKDMERIKKLTNKEMNYIGNLKLSYLAEEKNNELSTDKYNKLSNYKILMFASTHKNEEILFIDLFKKLILENQNLKIMIVPRHPERANEILALLKNKKIESEILIKSSKFDEKVFVINSFGNMNLYYSFSDIVFLGGSMVKMGGHNPLEPAINNCVILTGPYIYNWENIFNDMINFKACFKFEKISEIKLFLSNIFNDSNKIQNLKRNAKIFAEKNFFDKKTLFNSINNMIIK